MRISRVIAAGLLLIGAVAPPPAIADPGDTWWDEGWPYRIPVSASGSGVAEVAIDFTAAFASLGLPEALLDLRSIRVVPYSGSVPAPPSLPYAESYSTTLDDTDTPQIDWHPAGVYWTVNDGDLEADSVRFSEGSGSLKATIDNLASGYGYPGVELHISSGEPLTDWRAYEALLYDVWPEVNQSALDQAPDLYSFKLYDTSGCAQGNITQGGPPVALDRWNRVSVSLRPLHTCTTPELSPITRLELHTRDNETVSGNSGLWDDGDQLILWLDHLRLVDQDLGSIRWQADAGTTSYYIYFDSLEHEGHAAPVLTSLGSATLSATANAAEAGGYFHQVDGAVSGGLAIWTAPVEEKILRGQELPAVEGFLRIQAAKGEHEPFQIVVRSPSLQDLAVGVSDLALGSETIGAANISLHRVDYVTLSNLSDHHGRLGQWPDPLYPVTLGETVSFPAGLNQPLWFTVEVPRDASAGIYQGTVTVGPASIPIELEVWPFSLPSELHLAGEWGFGWSQVVETYQGTIGGSVQPCYWDLVDALYEDFADHRLTPKGVGWPAGLNYPGGVEYDCNGNLEPDAWGDWDFHTLAAKYLSGGELDNGSGFPSFLIRGPASNWPPDSRPNSFCGESRGTDPPGNPAYNAEWFQYWGEVSDYLGGTADYADKAYYHIVNEPQTFGDYDIVAYLAQETALAAPNVRILISEQVEPEIYDHPTYTGSKIDIWMPTISNYQVERAHDRQTHHGEEVWWYFLYGDRPPLPNPTIIDRSGIEARIIPWLAWKERVQGLLYYSTTDWSPDPWLDPWTNDANGDGFLFYPPLDSSIAFDACEASSNRLVPSIRWELLREGMEDYEYLWLVAGGDPGIGVDNAADMLVDQWIGSRTLFSRVPTDLRAARAALAAAIGSIFRDGFESGDTSGWTRTVPTELAPRVAPTQDRLPSNRKQKAKSSRF